MSDLIQLEDLQPEALGEVIRARAGEFDKATLRAVEHAWHAGRALLAAKKMIAHGQWGQWLSDNFEGRSHDTARIWMRLAANYESVRNLEDVKHGIKLLDEAPERQAKRAEREAKKLEASAKPPAPAPAAPGAPAKNEHASPEVIAEVDAGRMSIHKAQKLIAALPDKTRQALAVKADAVDEMIAAHAAERQAAAARGAAESKPAWLADPDEIDRPEEDDLPPLPKTNTHHTSANRRTPDARETDSVGIVPPDDPRTYHDGNWYEWSEPLNRMISVSEDDIVAEADRIRQWRCGLAAVEPAVTTSPVVEPTKESVSSKPGKVPTAQQLTTAVGDRVHDGDWQDLWRGKLERAVEAWARYKQSLTGKAKVRSMESWEAALTRMENVAHDRGVDAVCDMIEKAIANGWQGWEHETNGSRGGSRISTAVRSNRNWDEEIPEWKPTE